MVHKITVKINVWGTQNKLSSPQETEAYLSLNAKSTSVIHNSFAHPCNCLGSAFRSVTQYR